MTVEQGLFGPIRGKIGACAAATFRYDTRRSVTVRGRRTTETSGTRSLLSRLPREQVAGAGVHPRRWKIVATDRNLTCADCGQEFVFTANEQDFYTERGFSDPRRCPACRQARKAQRGASTGGSGGYSSGGGGYSSGGYSSGGEGGYSSGGGGGYSSGGGRLQLRRQPQLLRPPAARDVRGNLLQLRQVAKVPFRPTERQARLLHRLLRQAPRVTSRSSKRHMERPPGNRRAFLSSGPGRVSRSARLLLPRPMPPGRLQRPRQPHRSRSR